MKPSLRKISVLLVLAFVLALGAALVNPRLPQWNRNALADGEVEVGTVRQWSEKVLWVDARARDRFDAGHIPGALLLNSYEWEKLLDPFLDEWERGRPVVVYCDSAGCDLSRQVANRLRKEVQLTKVYVLKGGWKAWRESKK